VEEHDIVAPSPWVVRWATLITRGEVLDVACGVGGIRSGCWSKASESSRSIACPSRYRGPVSCTPISRPVVHGRSPRERFAGIVVTNYLHRPLLPHLLASLAPDGVLIYETFMSGNERYGKPSNPAFLLRAGELFEAFRSIARSRVRAGTHCDA
jgi:hypothetical protein